VSAADWFGAGFVAGMWVSILVVFLATKSWLR
jgi:hypothetical protein